MHFTTSFLLLLTALFTFSLATPIPDFEDIERHWSKGETEVRPQRQQPHQQPTVPSTTPAKTCVSVLSGCYISAWVRRLAGAVGRRDSIHAHANIRTATPAWPVARSANPASFMTTPDELTQRRSLAEHGENNALGARLQSFASRLLRSKGEAGVIESRGMERRGLERRDGEAPVLRPRREMRYHFTA